VSNNRISSNM